MTPYYHEGGVTIYVGDMLEIMPSFADGAFDGFVADPPYTSAGGSSNGRNSQEDDQFFAFWVRHVAAELERATVPDGAGFVFCDWRTVGLVRAAFRTPGSRLGGRGWDATQALVWDRELIGLGSPFRNAYEMIAFCRGPRFKSAHIPRNVSTVIRHRWFYGNHEFGASEKPVDLCLQLLQWTGSKRRVVDPFVGSGPTLLAARRLGIPAVGITMNEADAEIAARRCSQEVLVLPEASA